MPEDLVKEIRIANPDDYKRIEQEKIVKSIDSKIIEKDFKRISDELGLEHSNHLLNEGIVSALMGAIYAFYDRKLDPFHVNHFPLYRVIIEDIKIAFDEVSQGQIDRELWLFETFDYGIKQVYYLDWKLYLSQICY